MILFASPWRTDKNIGDAYDSIMQLLPSDDDFVCFVDGDAMFLHPYWGRCIEEVLSSNPHAECLTAYTNRIWYDKSNSHGAGVWQIPNDVDMSSNDISYHRNFGLKLWNQYGTTVLDVTNVPETQLLSGVLILVNKRTWKRIGKLPSGMLGIDQEIHRRLKQCGTRLYLMQGIYLYHWYRNNDPFNFAHLEKVSRCPPFIRLIFRKMRWNVISIIKRFFKR